MTKKYSINWENDEIVSVEVDGVTYADPEDIPDPEDRAQVERLIARTARAESDQELDDELDKEFGQAFDRDFEEKSRQLERDSARFPKIIVGIFAFIAILMLGIAAVSTAGAIQALAREQSAPGRVVDLVVRRDEDRQAFYFPVVEFDLPDESRQRVQLSEGSSTPEYTQNQAVTVRYDPDNPAGTARIDSFGSAVLLWILPAIAGIIGAAFLAAAIFAGWFLRPEKTTP